MDLGSVAVIALIAGLAGGAVGAALVGTVEGMMRQRQVVRGSTAYGGGWRGGGWRSSLTSTYTAVNFERLDTDSRKIMTLARQEAIQSGHSYIGTEHLAVALRLHRTPALDKIWGQLPVDLETLRRRIEVAVPPTLGATMPTQLRTTPRVGTIVTMANALATKRKEELISPELFLMALVDEGGGVGAQVLASLGATVQRIREIVDGATS
ncbi:MAG TPA: Clp protease N-terminal domain-containing protein [Candidatus Limnocylindria bacterium]